MTTDLYTTEEAAVEVGVTRATIYSWIHRGHLTAADKRGRRKLFRLADVFTAESTRKRQHRRRSTP